MGPDLLCPIHPPNRAGIGWIGRGLTEALRERGAHGVRRAPRDHHGPDRMGRRGRPRPANRLRIHPEASTERNHQMIPETAIEAACHAYRHPDTNTSDGSHRDCMEAALEAALPHLEA